LSPSILNLDWQQVEKKIKLFIKNSIEKTNTSGIILGVSGGVDSCTAAALSSLAIGGENVLGLFLPEKETANKTNMKHAEIVARKFNFKLEIIDITSILEAFYESLPIYSAKDKLYKGNLKARTRMTLIYYYANKLNRLVCGSSDKSETMIGYFTKWGDIAADISPLMDLYKTQVRQLALHIGIPKAIATKPASPNLWPKQLAEKEIGLKYEILDLVLYGLEHFMKTEDIAQQLCLPLETIEKVKRRWLSMEHKRRMPLTLKLGYRTVGADFRLPYNPT
jgi:NAD+ synthase